MSHEDRSTAGSCDSIVRLLPARDTIDSVGVARRRRRVRVEDRALNRHDGQEHDREDEDARDELEHDRATLKSLQSEGISPRGTVAKPYANEVPQERRKTKTA